MEKSKSKSNSKYNKYQHLSSLKLLFGPRISNWSYDKNKLFYVTPYLICLQVVKYADYLYNNHNTNNNQPSNLLLWDMFGGIGTDTINFAKYFSILTTEIDQNTFKLLKHNITQYRISNVNLMNINCLDIIDKITTDIVYYDPPWGDNYNSKINTFDFNTLNITNSKNETFSYVKIILKIYNTITKKIIIKSPLNSYTFDNIFKNKIKYTLIYPKKNLKFIFIMAGD